MFNTRWNAFTQFCAICVLCAWEVLCYGVACNVWISMCENIMRSGTLYESFVLSIKKEEEETTALGIRDRKQNKNKMRIREKYSERRKNTSVLCYFLLHNNFD